MKTIKAEIGHGNYSETLYASASTAKEALARLIFESKNNYLPDLNSAGFDEVCSGLEAGKRTGRGWVWFELVETPQKPNADLAAVPEMLAALEYAAEVLKLAGRYFPKSIKNGDKFSLLNATATVDKAIAKAKGCQ